MKKRSRDPAIWALRLAGRGTPWLTPASLRAQIAYFLSDRKVFRAGTDSPE
ncbi:hypothetical protein L248_3130 [Schleiferilactobacillus shenzhenensis LY-73]|uniref:Uncharacterized protein n=1 Tax=Schleiferilactobacillus shenzhenensis LY-73 TaxID=1231336 RepID=U4TSW2_9LACO|nr:hypothetical protein L248_3130 [Schleiferilactobacillus shenzhenensis LY-73]